MTQCDIQKSEKERERETERKKKNGQKTNMIPFQSHITIYYVLTVTALYFQTKTIFRLFNLKNSIVIAIVTKNVDEDWKPVPK